MRLSPLPVAPEPVIDYQAAFWLPAAPREVWDTIERFDEFESWWPWLRTFHADRHGLVDGNVLHGTVVPPLPYRFHVTVRLVRCDRPQSIEATVSGDLRGTARLSLDASGDGTLAGVAWSLAMVRGPLRAAALVAYPLVRWGHDRVVDTTVAGFRQHALAIR